MPIKTLGWQFDLDWEGPYGEPCEDVIDALDYGLGPICTRFRGRRDLWRRDMTWVLRTYALELARDARFIPLTWRKRIQHQLAPLNACQKAIAWTVAGRARLASHPPIRRSPDEQVISLEWEGKYHSVPVRGTKLVDRSTTEDDRAARWFRERERARLELAAELEQQLGGEDMAVQRRCVHCGQPVQGRDKREAEAKLQQHVQSVHGWWR